jgi:tripartite-type tricarboxylate transporter receptor subunit TctC
VFVHGKGLQETCSYTVFKTGKDAVLSAGSEEENRRKEMRRITLIVCIVLVSAGTVVLASGRQDGAFPTRGIEIIHPWPPGVTMASTQVVAEAMSEELGVAITVIPTPGGTGVRAMETVLNRPADGYTIFDGWVAPLVVQSAMGNVDADHTDFIPLFALAAVPNAVLVRADDERFPDFEAFITYMRENPGELRYTSGAYGNLPHIVLANMMQATDTVAQNVPYGELEEGVVDLRGEVLDFMAGNPGFYRANRQHTRVLVALSELDSVAEIFGGVPKVTDYDFIDFPLTSLAPMGWSWFTVHKDTPADVVETLRNAMAVALEKPSVVEYFDRIGRVLLAYPPEDYLETVSAVREQISQATDAVEWEAEKLRSVQE